MAFSGLAIQTTYELIWGEVWRIASAVSAVKNLFHKEYFNLARYFVDSFFATV